MPGQAAFLDLPGNTSPGNPIHPIVTLTSTLTGDLTPTACIASVEVYGDLSGQTSVYFPPTPCAPSSTTWVEVAP